MNTIFLATVIGWYMLIFGLLIVLKHRYVKAAMTDILAQQGLYFVLAILTLIIGLLIVTTHHQWSTEWPVAITLFGWVILVGGLIRLFFPVTVHNMGKSFLKNTVKMKLFGISLALFGLYLLSHVYQFHDIGKLLF